MHTRPPQGLSKMRSGNNSGTDCIANVRARIAALRAALLDPSPEALEPHLPGLEEALSDLLCLQQEPALQTAQSDSSPSLASRLALRRDLQARSLDLRAAGSLIKHGIAFQEGWGRLLAAST